MRISGHNRCGMQVAKQVVGIGRSDPKNLHLGTKREKKMTKQMLMKSSLLAAVLALFIPMAAAAQGGYDPWGRPDYRRDNDRYGRYDNRYLRDSIHRLDRLAKEFERDMDRALDRSRADGTRREDILNNEARQFRHAVGNLKSRFGNGRDLNRSRNEAQRVLHEAQQLNRMPGGRRIDNRMAQRWSQIRQELRIISDAYGLGNYGYNDDYRNDRRRNPNDVPWWQRVLGVPN